MEVSNLKEINDDVFKLLENDYLINLKPLEQSVTEKHWMGYSPATLKAIATKEQELDAVLPQSYKDFFLVSNGLEILVLVYITSIQLKKLIGRESLRMNGG